jgi:hypothetical protein
LFPTVAQDELSADRNVDPELGWAGETDGIAVGYDPCRGNAKQTAPPMPA